MLSKTTCLSLLFLLFTCFCKAQTGNLDLLKEKYANKTMYIQKNKFIQGSNILRFKELEQVFVISPEALSLYRAAKKSRKVGAFLTGLSMGLFMGGLSLVQTNETAGIILYSGSIVSSGIAIPLLSKASKKMHKAVWLFNRDVLLNQ